MVYLEIHMLRNWQPSNVECHHLSAMIQGDLSPHADPYQSAHCCPVDFTYRCPVDRTADGEPDPCRLQGASGGPLLPRQLHRGAHRACAA